MAELEHDNYPLDQCPFCDYSLEGLPVEHRCPECGQPFDRRYCLFGQFSPWYYYPKWLKILISMLLLLLFTLNSKMLFYMTFTPSSIGYILFCVFWCLYLPITFFKKPSEFIAVNPDGITIVNRKNKTFDQYEWRRISEVDVSGSGKLMVKIDGEFQTFHTSSHQQKEMERCVKLIYRLYEDKLAKKHRRGSVHANQISDSADNLNQAG